MREPEFEDIQRELSLREHLTETNVQRRTFLKMLGAGATVASMPTWAQEMALAAPALGDNEGVIVVIQMGGGNDGLNTVIPTGQSAYYSNARLAWHQRRQCAEHCPRHWASSFPLPHKRHVRRGPGRRCAGCRLG